MKTRNIKSLWEFSALLKRSCPTANIPSFLLLLISIIICTFIVLKTRHMWTKLKNFPETLELCFVVNIVSFLLLLIIHVICTFLLQWKRETYGREPLGIPQRFLSCCRVKWLSLLARLSRPSQEPPGRPSRCCLSRETSQNEAFYA